MSIVHIILGLLLLMAVIYAILNIVQSKASDGLKMIWIAGVILAPFVGVIAWFFLGPKSAKG